MTATPDPFSARDTLEAGGRDHVVYRLDAVRDDLDRLPFTVKVLLENVLRFADGGHVEEADIGPSPGGRPPIRATKRSPSCPPGC